MVDLLHNSNKEYLDLTKIYELKDAEYFIIKPKGLWYSIGLEWLNWCKDENWPIHKYTHKLSIDYTNILKIGSILGLRVFEDKFKNKSEKIDSYRLIDWKKVMSIYNGIEINPYIYEARYIHDWYCGWDIASGCVWNLESIKNVEQVLTNTVVS